MATATFNQPDFTSQGGTLYKTSIDNSVMAIARLASSFAAHEQTVPDMTVRVDAGFIWDGETLTNIAAQNTGTITAPVSNPRIDRVVVDNATGAVSVITGAENVSPVAPDITLGKAPVCSILLATSTTAITNNLITDERTFDRGSGRSGEITNIASAATVDMGTVESHFANVTGTTGISSFGFTASTNDPLYLVRFDDVLTLSHSSTFQLPASSSIVTTAGDYSLWQYLGLGNGWRLLSYTRAGTLPVVYTPSTGSASIPATGSAESQLVLQERLSNGGNTATIVPASSLGANRTYTLPDASGTVALQETIVPPVFNNLQVFTSSGTFTPAAGVDKVFVRVWGAGGGGGGVGSANTLGAGGGGAGGYSEGFVTVTPSVGVTVTIGAAGAAGTSGGGNGGGGGGSGFAGGTTLTGNGGSGGTGTASFGASAGGAGGTGTGGTLNLSGGAGQGGGGASGVGIWGGGGGMPAVPAGVPGKFRPTNTEGQGVGFDAVGYGAGGGGANSSGSSYAGGAGAAGLVLVYYP
jgi:hypothetical protein